MIDFHSHILPFMDDGSASVEESLQMLKLSANQGVEIIVATPHFNLREESIADFLGRRQCAYELLAEAHLFKPKLPVVCLGAEVAYFPGISWSEELPRLCISGTRHLLLEMPLEPWSKRMLNEINGLMTGSEIIPIIAHIERYMSFNNGDKITELLNLGALIQMNAEFVISRLTRKKALKLLAMVHIHLLGSDSHSSKDHRADLGAAIRIIRRSLGQERINEIDVLGHSILSAAQQAAFYSYNSQIITT
ncbi:MAG: histidinol-phosphatase [Clostridiales bacterium]|nr:histidinol-phosphatase [Clostridiales bacterium]